MNIYESEETEVKNKVELKSWFEDDKLYVGEYVKHKINQLDEPEVNSQIDKLANFIMSEVEGEPSQNQGAVDTAIRIIKSYQNQETLSQEWIDKYKVDYDNWMPAVPIVHLQNLLVPKQELPVIPKFVAEWIEEMKQDERPLYSVMSNLMNKTNHEWTVWKSANKNFSEVVAQAWLDGFTVEKEQKYYAKIKGWELFVDFVGAQYWGEVSNYGRLGFVSIDGAKDRTKDEWERLGINDTNADFVKVEEIEE